MTPSLEELQSQYEKTVRASIAVHYLAARASYAADSDPTLFAHDLRRRLGARHTSHAEAILQRGTVGAATPADATWAGALVAQSTYTAALLEVLAPSSAWAAILAGGARRAPANVRVPVALTGTTGKWVGAGRSVPLSAMAFAAGVQLTPLKAGVIAAFTQELLRTSEAEPIVRKDLSRAIVNVVDTTLLSADAAVPDVSPAGLLEGLASVGAGVAIEDDLVALFAAVSSTSPTSLRLFLSKASALLLVQARSTDGARLVPDLALTGGDVFGVPAIITEAAGAHVILVDCDGIIVTDAGLELDTTTITSLEMSDSPTGDAASGTAPSSTVSMYQTGSAAIKAIRFVNWARGRADAVAFTTVEGSGS